MQAGRQRCMFGEGGVPACIKGEALVLLVHGVMAAAAAAPTGAGATFGERTPTSSSSSSSTRLTHIHNLGGGVSVPQDLLVLLDEGPLRYRQTGRQYSSSTVGRQYSKRQWPKCTVT